MSSALTVRNFRTVLAGSMAIWLSGIVLLFCCEMPGGKTEAAEFCPLTKAAKHCDNSESDTAGSSVAPTKRPSTESCSFIAAVFDKTRKLENGKPLTEPAAEKAVDTVRPSVAPTRSIFTRGSASRVGIAKNKTYLINRTLRI